MGLFSTLFGGRNADLPAMIRGGALLIDARTPAEFRSGHIEGAVNLPHNVIGTHISQIEADQSRPIVVYCQSGGRSAMAVGALKRAGYNTVENGGAIARLKRQLEQTNG
jgi:phage shock protein E